MDQSHDQKCQIQLIAEAHRVQIVTGAVAKASWPSKGHKATDVVHHTQQKQNQWCDQQRIVRDSSAQPIARQKIGEEQLIESERERLQIELTTATFVAGRTQTDDVLVVSSFEATTLGLTSMALVSGVIVVEAVDA